MTPLERRYRRLLWLLPASYRQQREDDMVASFLRRTLPGDAEDAAFTAEHGWPSGADVADVAALGMRLRLGGAGASSRSVAWGAAVRRVALAGLLVHAVLGLENLGWALWWLTWVSPPVPDPGVTVVHNWFTARDAATLLWTPAYVSVVCGHRRIAQVLAMTALAVLVAAYGYGMFVGGVFSISETYWLFLMALPVFALAAFHSESPPVRIRPWLVALPVGLVLLAGAPLAIPPDYREFVDLPGLMCVLVVAGAACLAAAGRGRGGPGASWSAALALLGVGVLGLRVVTLLDYLQADARTGELRTPITAGVVETVLMMAVSTVLVFVAARAFRQLTDEPAEQIPRHR